MATTKVKRSQIKHFLNTTPSSTATYSLLGTGVAEYGIGYNANVTTEQWITNDTATNSIESYNKSGPVSQTCYFGDAVFNYINSIRRNNYIGDDAKTDIIDVDIYDVTGANYKATKCDCVIEITNYAGGSEPKIEYVIHYSGEQDVGTVTISNGVPTFTEDNTSI